MVRTGRQPRPNPRWQLPAPQKYRLKVALPARFPQDAKTLLWTGFHSAQRRFPLEAGAIGGNMYLAAYVQRADATGWEDR